MSSNGIDFEVIMDDLLEKFEKFIYFLLISNINGAVLQNLIKLLFA